MAWSSVWHDNRNQVASHVHRNKLYDYYDDNDDDHYDTIFVAK